MFLDYNAVLCKDYVKMFLLIDDTINPCNHNLWKIIKKFYCFYYSFQLETEDNYMNWYVFGVLQEI